MSNFVGENPYYGGGGDGGGGGGFVPGGGSPFGSQDFKKGKGANSTIRPVTVKQLLEASQVPNDTDFTIDGLEVQQVTLVGSVHNKSASATNVQYQIGDGTGYIDVRLWLDSSDDESGKMDGIEQDKYVAIMGSIKVFGGKRHVSANHVRAITNHDEVFNHLLKALWVSLSIRNPGGPIGQGGAVHNDYNAGTSTTVDTSAWAGLPPIQRKVMEIVSAEDSEDGMHVSAVSRQVQSGDGQSVMDAIEDLMQNGHLFSTIDDLHIKAM